MQVAGGVTGHFKTRWPEWWVAVTLLGQSALITAGRNLHGNQLYSVIRNMVDVQQAATGAEIVAGMWVAALVLNGTFLAFRRISPWVRVLTATAASVYWAVWSVTLFQAASYTSVAWYNDAALATSAAMCVFMAAGEVAHADKKAKQWHRIRQRTGGR